MIRFTGSSRPDNNNTNNNRLFRSLFLKSLYKKDYIQRLSNKMQIDNNRQHTKRERVEDDGCVFKLHQNARVPVSVRSYLRPGRSRTEAEISAASGHSFSTSSSGPHRDLLKPRKDFFTAGWGGREGERGRERETQNLELMLSHRRRTQETIAHATCLPSGLSARKGFPPNP